MLGQVRSEFLWALAVIAALVLMALYMDAAHATGWGNNTYITNNYYENNTYIEDDSGVSDSDLDSAIAATMAATSIHCSTGTRKHQAGVATGYKSGKNAFALGYCKSISDNRAMTLGGTAAFASGTSPAYGVGLNWTW